MTKMCKLCLKQSFPFHLLNCGWLLHYADIQAFHHRDEVLRRLRVHIPNYEKGNKGLYKQIKGMLAIATSRAEHLRSRFSRLPGEEVYTNVDELVSILRSLMRGT